MISSESISYKHLKVSMFLFSTWLAQHPKNASWNTQSFWHWGKHASSCSWFEKEYEHALRQFPATLLELTAVSFFLPSIYQAAQICHFYHQIIAYGLVFWSSAQQTLPAIWHRRKHVVPPLQNLLPLGGIIRVTLIILGLYRHNQTLMRAMVEECLRGCMGTDKGTGLSMRQRGVRDREGDM